MTETGIIARVHHVKTQSHVDYLRTIFFGFIWPTKSEIVSEISNFWSKMVNLTEIQNFKGSIEFSVSNSVEKYSSKI